MMRDALPLLALGLLLKSTFLLLASGLICRLLHRTSAALRHLIWTAALAGVLLLPLLSLFLPPWHVPLTHAAALKTSVSLPIREYSSHFMSMKPASIDKTLALANTPTSVPQSHASARISWTIWGLIVWLTGALAVLLHLAVSLRRIGHIRHTSQALDERALAAFAMAWEQNGSGLRYGSVTVLRATDDAIIVPLTWGLMHPTILLPVHSRFWPDACLRAAFLHELAHIQRADWMMQMLGRLACAVYWFHPGIWWAARQMRDAGERACDDRVLLAGMPAADYAQHLLDVARSLPARQPSHTVAIAMAQPSEVEARIREILKKGRQRGRITRRGTVMLLMGTTLITLPLAALRLAAQTSPTLPESSGITTYFPVRDSNGVTVHNLTVSLDSIVTFGAPGAAPVWHDTAGRALPNALFAWPHLPSSFALHSPQQQICGLAVRFVKPTNTDVSVRWQVIDSDTGAVVPTAGESVGRSAQSKNWYAISALLPQSSSRCRLRVSLAAGLWQQTAKLSFGREPGLVFASSGIYRQRKDLTWYIFSGSGTRVNESEVAVRLSKNQTTVLLLDPHRDHDQRISAVDSQGKRIESAPFSMRARGAFQALAVFSVPLAHLHEFRLETRPFAKIEMGEIRLHPDSPPRRVLRNSISQKQTTALIPDESERAEKAVYAAYAAGSGRVALLNIPAAYQVDKASYKSTLRVLGMTMVGAQIIANTRQVDHVQVLDHATGKRHLVTINAFMEEMWLIRPQGWAIGWLHPLTVIEKMDGHVVSW